MKKRVILASLFVFFLLLLVGLGLLKEGTPQIVFEGRKMVKPVEEISQRDKLVTEVKTLALEENFPLLGEPETVGQTLVATFSVGTTIVFDPGKEIRNQLDSLQFILKRAKIEGKWPMMIDLRFTRPVLKY
jgi:hypothetical protein